MSVLQGLLRAAYGNPGGYSDEEVRRMYAEPRTVRGHYGPKPKAVEFERVHLRDLPEAIGLGIAGQLADGLDSGRFEAGGVSVRWSLT
jgi:hypothetical protein